MAGPTADFWQDKFETGQTPWDRRKVSTQLIEWLNRAVISAVPPDRIQGPVLVPGCGSGYEVIELARRGFDVIGIDYAPAAIHRANQQLIMLTHEQRRRVQLVQADLLGWQPSLAAGAVYEQTCLCAMHPDYWLAYAAQMMRWMQPGGRLMALFAQTLKSGAAEGQIQGPPYHCDIHAMRALFPEVYWDWPKPPYAKVDHPMGMYELAVVLRRRG